MYYRKYFEGEISNANETVSIAQVTSTSNKTIYANQTNVVCGAVAETLNACGVASSYLDYVLTIDGVRLNLVYTSTTNIANLVCGYEYAWAGSASTQTQPFDGASYKFYVTIKGDPQGELLIAIGAFANPSSDAFRFGLAKAKNNLTGRDAVLLLYSNGISNAIPLSLTGEILIREQTHSITSIQLETRTISNFDTKKSYADDSNIETLLPVVTKGYEFTLKNVYSQPYGAMKTANAFYRINGRTFYNNTGYLIECITQL